MSGYGRLALAYDALNEGIDYGAWADFILSCCARYSPRIYNEIASSCDGNLGREPVCLDLACGTGSMTLELEKRGFDMIGIDGSAEMLTMAREKLGDRSRTLLLEEDMRDFELAGRCDLCVCCLDSLNSLVGNGDLEACFSRVAKFLAPDGLFIFDVNSLWKFEHVYADNAYVLEGELEDGRRVLCAWQNFCKNRRATFYLSLFTEEKTKDAGERMYSRYDEVLRERAYDDAHIRKALAENGLAVRGMCGGFDFAAPAADAERIYYVAAPMRNS